jgi:hypothetical protein
MIVQALWRRRPAWQWPTLLASLELGPISSAAIRLILTVSLFAWLPGLGLAEDSALQPAPSVRPPLLRHIVLEPEESRDDHDRLLASVIFNGTDASIVRVNLYPDLFPHRTLDLGLFFGIAQHGEPTFGIAIEKLVAFGVS